MQKSVAGSLFTDKGQENKERRWSVKHDTF